MNREQVSAQQLLFYGQPDVPSKKDLECAWRAVKTIAGVGRLLSKDEQQCLLGRMSAMGAPSEVVQHVMAFDARSERPESVVAGIRACAKTRWLTPAWVLYEGLSVAMSDGELHASELEVLRSIAIGLDVPPDTFDELVQVCDEEAMLRRRRIDLLFSEIVPILHFDQL